MTEETDIDDVNIIINSNNFLKIQQSETSKVLKTFFFITCQKLLDAVSKKAKYYYNFFKCPETMKKL